MSYILDALNKSDQEKQKRRETPGLDANHAGPAKPARSIWPWVVGFAVLVGMNGAALFWWLNQAPTEVATPAAQPDAVVASPAAPIPEQQAATIELANPEPLPSASEPVAIAALPESVQRALPELVFSSHIFASDADLRMVNINGKSLREGDIVGGGVRLVEVTEEGVILDYQGNRFEVSVLRDWFPPN